LSHGDAAAYGSGIAMSTALRPLDPAIDSKIRRSFEHQLIMGTLGARLARVESGLCAIELDFDPRFTQQLGLLHAGVTTAIADSAGGYAALSLMPAGGSILTIEYKVNFLAPAAGERFVATGRCVKSGRRIFVSEIEVRALRGARDTLCLFGLATNLCLPEAPGGGPPR
jgi:uncharacterized protein (TIGR00369 family)